MSKNSLILISLFLLFHKIYPSIAVAEATGMVMAMNSKNSHILLNTILKFLNPLINKIEFNNGQIDSSIVLDYGYLHIDPIESKQAGISFFDETNVFFKASNLSTSIHIDFHLMDGYYMHKGSIDASGFISKILIDFSPAECGVPCLPIFTENIIQFDLNKESFIVKVDGENIPENMGGLLTGLFKEKVLGNIKKEIMNLLNSTGNSLIEEIIRKNYVGSIAINDSIKLNLELNKQIMVNKNGLFANVVGISNKPIPYKLASPEIQFKLNKKAEMGVFIFASEFEQLLSLNPSFCYKTKYGEIDIQMKNTSDLQVIISKDDMCIKNLKVKAELQVYGFKVLTIDSSVDVSLNMNVSTITDKDGNKFSVKHQIKKFRLFDFSISSILKDLSVVQDMIKNAIEGFVYESTKADQLVLNSFDFGQFKLNYFKEDFLDGMVRVQASLNGDDEISAEDLIKEIQGSFQNILNMNFETMIEKYMSSKLLELIMSHINSIGK